MINLHVKKNDDVDGDFYDFTIVVDTGTTITGTTPGLVTPEDLEVVLTDLKDQIEDLLPLFEK